VWGLASCALARLIVPGKGEDFDKWVVDMLTINDIVTIEQLAHVSLGDLTLPDTTTAGKRLFLKAGSWFAQSCPWARGVASVVPGSSGCVQPASRPTAQGNRGTS